ncbi:MAG: hypothetical protein DKT66_23225 [Candidatus Melainabacteria bacterium]|nr:MAG: hypothetical protein DKT66_23225 [Candidatus Melainabacteria bacterium]
MGYYKIGAQCIGTFDKVEDEDTDAIIGEELVVDHWPEDDILSAMVGGHFVTRRLADALSNAALTGFQLKPVNIVEGEQLYVSRKVHPGEEMPEILQLELTGKAGKDDFGRDKVLVVSERAMELLKKFSFKYRIVEDYVTV